MKKRPNEQLIISIKNLKAHMKFHKLILSMGIAITIVAMAATEALACSCLQKSSVCNAFGDAKAVFIGKVVEGNSVERMSDMIKAGTKDLTFTFKVSRGFVGAKADQTIDVHTGFGFGDCGFPFEKGEEYIVYAYQSDDRKALSTGICTRTTHISRADEDIAELEALFKSDGSSVTGAITRYERSSLLGPPNVPMTAARVKLIRIEDGKAFLARTNSTGQFTFLGLGSGKYRLVPPVGKGWQVEDYDTEEFFLNEHGCATKDISIKSETEIEVNVIDPNGSPVPSIWVELVPTSINPPTGVRTPDEFTVTNAQGEARFYDTPPGKYTISVNFFNAPDKEAPFPAVFAPGVEGRSRAQVFEIRPGTNITKTIVIKIPRSLEPISLSGIVVYQSGKPAKGVQVNLVDEKEPDICINGCGETNERGEFTLNGYRGRRYTIEALLRDVADNPSYLGVTQPFVLEPSPKAVRISLKRLDEKY